MANLANIIDGGFNASQYEDQPEFDDSPIPAGEYYAEIENAELKDTKNGAGTGCNTTFNVLGHVGDKSQKGRKTFNWFNLTHSNDVAEKIGRQEFANLCKAIGKPMLQDTDELLGSQLVIKIGFDKKDATRNQIKRYIALDGYDASKAEAPAPAPTAPAAPAAAATKKQPWE